MEQTTSTVPSAVRPPFELAQTIETSLDWYVVARTLMSLARDSAPWMKAYAKLTALVTIALEGVIDRRTSGGSPLVAQREVREIKALMPPQTDLYRAACECEELIGSPN